KRFDDQSMRSSSTNFSRGTRQDIQPSSKPFPSNLTTKLKLPFRKNAPLFILFSVPGGIAIKGLSGSIPPSNIGHSPDQSTGKINVSRPVFTRFFSFGRIARNTPYQSPDGVSTRSA